MIDRFLNAVVRRLNVRSVAGAGIVLGVAAFLLTLPPFTLRTTLVPIIFGLGALAHEPLLHRELTVGVAHGDSRADAVVGHLREGRAA